MILTLKYPNKDIPLKQIWVLLWIWDFPGRTRAVAFKIFESSVAGGFHPHASIDKESTQDLFEKYLLANFAGQAKEEMLRQKPIKSILLITWTIRWDHSRLKYKICNTHASTIKQCSRKLLWFNHLASDTFFFRMPRSMRLGCSSTGGLSLSPLPTSGSSSLLETSTFL